MKSYDFFSYGLLVACPFRSQLPTCPLTELRKYPFSERIEKLEKMTSNELLKLELHHRKCLDSRKKLNHI